MAQKYLFYRNIVCKNVACDVGLYEEFFNVTPVSIGTVDDQQRRWLPAKEFSIDNPEMREDKDYMTMKYEERSMDLDMVINVSHSFYFYR